MILNPLNEANKREKDKKTPKKTETKQEKLK